MNLYLLAYLVIAALIMIPTWREGDKNNLPFVNRLEGMILALLWPALILLVALVAIADKYRLNLQVLLVFGSIFAALLGCTAYLGYELAKD